MPPAANDSDAQAPLQHNQGPPSPRHKSAGIASSDDAAALAANPAELTHFVDNVLDQLQGRFEQMSGQILGKMEEMAARMDELESSIMELMQQTESGLDPSMETATAMPSHTDDTANGGIEGDAQQQLE